MRASTTVSVRLAGACLAAAAALAGAAAGATADAPPVGPLPASPIQTRTLGQGATLRLELPAPTVAGGVWRIARAFDARVVRQVGEGDLAGGGVWLSFRAVGPGTTTIVVAETRGETATALAVRRTRVTVRAAASSGCPAAPAVLGPNPVSPAAAAALAEESRADRPQVTSATVASVDPGRGPEVGRLCGARVRERTVVVYVVARALLPSASLSQHVYLVSRAADGYHVWKQLR